MLIETHGILQNDSKCSVSIPVICLLHGIEPSTAREEKYISIVNSTGRSAAWQADAAMMPTAFSDDGTVGRHDVNLALSVPAKDQRQCSSETVLICSLNRSVLMC